MLVVIMLVMGVDNGVFNHYSVYCRSAGSWKGCHSYLVVDRSKKTPILCILLIYRSSLYNDRTKWNLKIFIVRG